MAKNSQFAVIGLGRFGQAIVQTLIENGKDVLACDKNQEIVQEVSKIATHVVRVDVKEPEALNALGLNNFDVVIIAMTSDMEATIMATMMAKEKGVKHVLVKAQNKIQKSILEKVGADRVVLPEREMGIRVATNLVSTNVLEYITLSDKYSIAEIEPLKEWVGKTLMESGIRQDYKVNVVVLKRTQQLIVSPSPTEVIQADDIVVVIGSNKDLQAISEKNGGSKNDRE